MTRAFPTRRSAGVGGGSTRGEGESQVRSPFAMTGYWRDPDATAAAVAADGWRCTGDVGVFTDRVELRLVGRVHDVFKSGGYTVYPKSIEDVLPACPGVAEAAVVHTPDPLYGAHPQAFVRIPTPVP